MATTDVSDSSLYNNGCQSREGSVCGGSTRLGSFEAARTRALVDLVQSQRTHLYGPEDQEHMKTVYSNICCDSGPDATRPDSPTSLGPRSNEDSTAPAPDANPDVTIKWDRPASQRSQSNIDLDVTVKSGNTSSALGCGGGGAQPSTRSKRRKKPNSLIASGAKKVSGWITPTIGGLKRILCIPGCLPHRRRKRGLAEG